MMFGWIEICLLTGAAAFLLLRVLLLLNAVTSLGQYRSLIGGGGVLLLITSLFPRTSNPLGEFLFGTSGTGLRLPLEVFGVVWWILGAWLFKSVLDLVLERTLFPDNNEPHSRRLYADLASGLIYVVAFVGIVGTVFNEPVSTFLATSGVVAIVLGFALQSTLGDVLSGLAINIERPFYTGDWITVAGQLPGEVMQVNWRATRLRTWSNDMVVIPNSVISKALVTNHSRPKGPHLCIICLSVDLSVAPSRVIETLIEAATQSPNLAGGTAPQVYACNFSASLMDYELAFAINGFAMFPRMRSDMLKRIAEAFRKHDISLGAAATDVRIIQGGDPKIAAVPSLGSQSKRGL